MPTRRRRFNVQNEIVNRPQPKKQNETQINFPDPDLGEINYAKNVIVRCTKSKTKVYPNTSKLSSIVESSTSSGTICKETTANSNNNELSLLKNNNDSIIVCTSKENVGNHDEVYTKPIESKDMDRNNVKTERSSRRDRHSHRIKVRSPKRKLVIDKNICKKKSIGIDAIDCEDDAIVETEVEVTATQVTDVAENTEDEERLSSHSMEDTCMCRICHSGEATSIELGRLISACSCRGTVGRVHVKCLERWLTESGKSRCELCGTKYVTKRVHKFGILKALAMWILSNNSKHMIVDFFGIMIMTPIAVVAAGLTGRTFAGLMEQTQLTPWPLASTFVLACMTLVCYYCWIVSALTRHALGWWIWYRAHYEVRLQLQDDDEQSSVSIANSNLYC